MRPALSEQADLHMVSIRNCAFIWPYCVFGEIVYSLGVFIHRFDWPMKNK